MINIVLPDLKDVRAVVVDYLGLLVSSEKTTDNHEQIIVNCENIFSLLIRTCELAQLHGNLEQLVYTLFIRDIFLPVCLPKHLKNIHEEEIRKMIGTLGGVIKMRKSSSSFYADKVCHTDQ